MELQERIKSNVTIDARSQCWEWNSRRDRDGYGRATLRSKTTMAHRVSYEAFVGPIPPGKEIDHLCRNRGCVNPQHLEAVSHRENTLRGETIPARHLQKTHCVKGHPLSGDNLRVVGVERICKECNREAARNYQRREALKRKEGKQP